MEDIWFVDTPKWLETTISQFLDAIDSNENWNDSDKIAFALTHLKGPADMFSKKHFRQNMEWNFIKMKLHQQFKCQIDIWDKVEMKKDLIQTENESMKDFFNRCVSCQYIICDDYGESVMDNDIMINFLIGMKKDIFDALYERLILSKKPLDLSVCLSEAEFLESGMMSNNDDDNNSDNKFNNKSKLTTAIIVDGTNNVKHEEIQIDQNIVKHEIEDYIDVDDNFANNGSDDIADFQDTNEETTVDNNDDDTFGQDEPDEEYDSDEPLGNKKSSKSSKKSSRRQRPSIATKYKKHDFSHLTTMEDGKVLCSKCGKISKSMESARSHTYREHVPQQFFRCNLCIYTGSKINFRCHLSLNHKLKGKNLVSTHGTEIDQTEANVVRYDKNKIQNSCLAAEMKLEPEVRIKQEQAFDDDNASFSSNQSTPVKQKVKRIILQQFKCDACEKIYSTKGNFKQHMNLVHGEDLDGTQIEVGDNTKICGKSDHKLLGDIKKCDYCDIQITMGNNKRHYHKHLQVKHPEKTAKCGSCTKIFYEDGVGTAAVDIQKALELHIVKYHGEIDPANPNNRLCTICKKSVSLIHIKDHVRKIHYGDKPFECPYCPTTFLYKTLR